MVLTAEETQEAQTPAWAKETIPEAFRKFQAKGGLSEPWHSKPGPLGNKVLGIDRWQANHFIVYRPETEAFLYGPYTSGASASWCTSHVGQAFLPDLVGQECPTYLDSRDHCTKSEMRPYTSTTVMVKPGLLPLFERTAAVYAAGLKTAEEKATAFVTRALPERFPHATVPPVGPFCRTDRALLDEPLLASGCGFCNEQARVFIRLCQVSGIPARLVFLFYADKATGHTTAEFWTGSKWAMVDVSWYVVFPGPDGALMSAAECHGNNAHRGLMADAYYGRMQRIVDLPDEALCGRAIPGATPDRLEAVRVKAGELRVKAGEHMGKDYLIRHLWQFGIINYPLPA